MPFEPTPEQDAVIGHDVSRHARILAGPGTGKSATVVALIDRLMSEDEPPHIRLLTFTRAATGELASKVSNLSTVEVERPSTIHSFSISVLVRNEGAASYPEPLRMADDWEYRQLLRPTLARRVGVGVRRLNLLVTEMAAGWESLEPHEDPRISAEERARFLGAWNEHRQVYGYTLLAELPYQLRSALENHPELVGVDYDALFVDEYQDLNACDLDVLRLIADRGCSIIAIGDDDQSIYSFRMAAPEGIRRFPNDYLHASEYPLSVSQRCATRILDWATHVIEGDPGRPRRPRLTPRDGAALGEVAFLSFSSATSEAAGKALLIRGLVEEEGLSASDILVLHRGDHNGHFTRGIKDALDAVGIAYSDPERIVDLVNLDEHRLLLALCRLLSDPEDSIAWAGLLHLTQGIGDAFVNHIYGLASGSRSRFGETLLESRPDFDGAPVASARRATQLIERVQAWIERHPIPDDVSWPDFLAEVAMDEPAAGISLEFRELLDDVADLVEEDTPLPRFLGQIIPLAKDIAAAQSEGVRFMSMGGSKGLTVRATIVGGLEDGVVPRPEADLAEERRLLYVSMTRATDYLFCTWARSRTGPTARAGSGRAGLRQPTHFLEGGPVRSEDGETYLNDRWR